jgi:DNA-binding response OmpR family regulator
VPRILVIDDEPELVRFVRRALEADGHQVWTALDGAEGLRLALGESPDLVVLDLLMPGIGGRAVLSGIMSQAPETPVLVLSADACVGARVEALEAGAVDFVAKPFAIRELLARVTRHLRALPAATTRQRALQVGGATLDLEERTLSIHGRVCSLSQREFLLLLHLMRRAGNVCTRQELLSEVWGYSFDPDTNVVDVCVARVRHKSGADLIQTVRNVGYQLQAV